PFSPAEFQALARSGQLRATDKVWLQGMPRWLPAGTLDWIFAAPAPAVPQRPGEQPVPVFAEVIPEEEPEPATPRAPGHRGTVAGSHAEPRAVEPEAGGRPARRRAVVESVAPKGTSVLGVMSLVLGCVGLPLSIVPCLNFLSLPFVGIGLLLGII